MTDTNAKLIKKEKQRISKRIAKIAYDVALFNTNANGCNFKYDILFRISSSMEGFCINIFSDDTSEQIEDFNLYNISHYFPDSFLFTNKQIKALDAKIDEAEELVKKYIKLNSKNQ